MKVLSLLCLSSILSSILCLGCVARDTEKRPPGIQSPWGLTSSGELEAYTFTHLAVTWDGEVVHGKAFIAEGRIITALHLTDSLPVWERGARDSVVLGGADVYGLSLCKTKHKGGQVLYSKTLRGVLLFTIMEGMDQEYRVVSVPPVKAGDSGTPVICLDHHRVVGLISSTCFGSRPYSDSRVAYLP